MSPTQVALWGAYLGLVEAHRQGFLTSTVEFDNREAFDTISTQEFIFIPQELEEVVKQINTFHANHSNSGKSERFVAIIALRMNSTAEYMAQYGKANFASVVQTPGDFWNIIHFLEADM